MTHIAYREVIWQVELKPAGLGAIIALMKPTIAGCQGSGLHKRGKQRKGFSSASIDEI